LYTEVHNCRDVSGQTTGYMSNWGGDEDRMQKDRTQTPEKA